MSGGIIFAYFSTLHELDDVFFFPSFLLRLLEGILQYRNHVAGNNPLTISLLFPSVFLCIVVK